MESSQQPHSQSEPQRIIMLPSRHVPQQLAQSIVDLKDFSLRFINGYRNILQLSPNSQPEWALTPNQDFCGQAFCYLLKPTTNKQEIIKVQVGEGHVIHPASQQMFVLQSVTGFTPNTLTITSQMLNKLIQDVAQSKSSHKIGINLVKNAFESFEAYNKSVGEQLQKLEQKLNSSIEQKIPTVGESLRLEEQVKKLQGQMISQLPKCNRETGQWDEGETTEIKLSAE